MHTLSPNSPRKTKDKQNFRCEKVQRALFNMRNERDSQPVQLVLLMRRAGRPLGFSTPPLWPSLSVKAELSALGLPALYYGNTTPWERATHRASNSREHSAELAPASTHLASDWMLNLSRNRIIMLQKHQGRAGHFPLLPAAIGIVPLSNQMFSFTSWAESASLCTACLTLSTAWRPTAHLFH